MGEIPQLTDSNPVNYGFTDFKSFDQLKEVSEKIQVIYEAANNETFNKLYEDLEIAENIVFLGFGFNKENLKRLGFLRRNINYELEKPPKIYATTYDLTENEVEYKIRSYLSDYYNQLNQIKGFFVNVKEDFIYENTGNLEFLRNHFNMRNLFA